MIKLFDKLMNENTKEVFNLPVKVKYVCFMDYRNCKVHFCTIKIPKELNDYDEGSYIEDELTEKYGYNSDCYYMSSDSPLTATIH